MKQTPGEVATFVASTEIIRLREWLEGVRDFAERCMPHATGQGHMALMSIKNAVTKALNGEDEAKYKFKNRAEDQEE